MAAELYEVRAFRTAVTLADVVVAPEGEVESKNGNFVIDRDGFAAILAAFSKHGADLPVDYEHQTLGGKFSAPDGRAPAAGWIKAVEYVQGKGIVAKVEWTDKARLMIQSGEYGYISPVVLVRKSDRRAVELHSVALTNKPAIARLERLVAKELGFMAGKEKDKPKTQANQDPAMGEGMGDPMLALARIAEAMGLSDIPNEAGAIAEAVLAKVRELMKGEGEEEGGGGEEAAAAKESLGKIASRLGVAKDASLERIVSKIDEIRSTTVDAQKYEELQASVAELKGKETERVVNAEIDKAVKSGKINANDTETVDYWRKVCAENVEHFRKLMEKAPRVWAGDGTVSDNASSASPNDSTRSRLIKKYADEWTAHRDQPELEQTSVVSYVTSCLQLEGHAALTNSERESLKVKENK